MSFAAMGASGSSGAWNSHTYADLWAVGKGLDRIVGWRSILGGERLRQQRRLEEPHVRRPVGSGQGSEGKVEGMHLAFHELERCAPWAAAACNSHTCASLHARVG